jgi:hypothetical protein
VYFCKHHKNFTIFWLFLQARPICNCVAVVQCSAHIAAKHHFAQTRRTKDTALWALRDGLN